jgi:hypothetical protein
LKEFQYDQEQYRRLGLEQAPKRCPECIDKAQLRPDHTLARREIFAASVVIESLPGEWEQTPADYQGKSVTVPSWHMYVKGRRFGASWNGRIDIWAQGERPTATGDIVYLRYMEVDKRIAKKSWSLQTLEHGFISGERQVAITRLGEEGVREDTETRRYIRLEPTTEYPDGTLMWLEAKTKTTLKGFGRQYWAHLQGDGLFKLEVYGAYRTGRAYTSGWLVVVDQDHPVWHVHTEDGETITTRIPAEK